MLQQVHSVVIVNMTQGPCQHDRGQRQLDKVMVSMTRVQRAATPHALLCTDLPLRIHAAMDYVAAKQNDIPHNLLCMPCPLII